MKSTLNLFVLLSLFFAIQTNAQLPVERVFEQTYQKETRNISGLPGKNYWQNKAEYDIKLNFNPINRLLSGTVEVEYFNNSPDKLNEIWFKLYQNLYKKEGAQKSRVNEKDLGEGLVITSFFTDGSSTPLNNLVIQGTNMHLAVPELGAGKSMKFKISFHFVLNKGSHLRSGEVDSGAHFLAYFFPRIAVYDDIDGWNKIPYRGTEEFYNDFSDFKVAITLPKNYAAWATGDLTNPTSVFSKSVSEKLQLAEKTEKTINVIDSLDLAQNNVTQQKPFNTFKFTAKNVVDFAFGTSNHYLWKSNSLVVDPTTGRRTRVDAVFNPKHKDFYEVIDFAHQTVYAMSYHFPKWPFPFSHQTIFDGLAQMEYPMMANDNPVSKREDAITLTDHEIFHAMFPFYMGINETKHAWMEEGWATIGEWLISPMIDSTIVDDYGVIPTGTASGNSDDAPIVTLTTDLKGRGSFTNSYPKPGFGYLFVKDYLGEELFTKALHHYIRTWNGKHPMPYDFFYSMNTGSGKNLDWFWKRWFFEGGVTDMAIKNVTKTAVGYQIDIENKSNKPMPIDLTFTYEDGTLSTLHHTIGVWENGGRVFSSMLNTAKKVTKVVLKSTHVPDKDRSDNTFLVN